ncbi:hypothetical protein [uncultured Pseudomonas sp.]|uniref:hypothetical protein n=1 Tax=uncultured Pseudomonas sp. TaxID=114707 RepID=UPI0026167494|nr:hypothetical protein [uncultured Pseudomonas sp.]
MYESKSSLLIDKKAFRRRVGLHVLVAFTLVVLTLMLGIAGHVYFDDMALDAALVASITLTSGLGLSVIPESTAGKLFTSLFGIFSGYVYIATSTIVIAPILHRLLHKFHLDQ